MATGRTDYPNQANNVLGFPGVFRGALDVQATCINEDMKIAAARALAQLARDDVPESVSEAYDDKQFSFGPHYILPKPFDPRVVQKVASAVAKAAIKTKVAKKTIKDFKIYEERLESLEGVKKSFIRKLINRILIESKKQNKKPQIVFPEGDSHQILKAVNQALIESMIEPILIGDKDKINNELKKLGFKKHFKNVAVIQPKEYKHYEKLSQKFFHKRQRKGVTFKEAERLMANPYYLSAMMLEEGHVEGLVSGARQNYADCIRPVLQIVTLGKSKVASGLNIVLFKEKILFFADTTININPTENQLAFIAYHAAKSAQFFGIQPRIAMLSYSNFTGYQTNPQKMVKACKILNELFPHLTVDGEVQADTAINTKIIKRIFPFSNLKEGANVLIFPNLDSSNIAYKLLQQLSGGEVLGPFIMGVKKPAHIVQRTGTISDIFNTIVITALHSLLLEDINKS